VPEIIGRVLPDKDEPRGPDAGLKVRVVRDWLVRGEQIELEIPRHLTCARCDGGGCDACERSGAITVRGRQEPAELVQVTLPKRDVADDETTVLLRIPGHGGFSTEPGLPRGVLLLRVTPADVADESVWLLKGVPSVRGPALPSRQKLIVTSVALVILLIALFVFLMRFSGWL
jgi:hypothetical protein